MGGGIAAPAIAAGEAMRTRRIKVVLMAAALGALSQGGGVAAQSPVEISGFYGGVALRDRSTGDAGWTFGPGTPVAVSVTAPLPEDAAARHTLFGGYRWRNQFAVEAALARSETYSLRPYGGASQAGVGLRLAGDGGLAGAAWNVDVVGGYTIRQALALYGRIGYAQAEGAGLHAAVPEARTGRDGVNYGVGLRYDITRELGVNLEYTRFGRFAFESTGNAFPESDRVRVGVRFRF